MAKQTFTTGQVLTAAQVTALQTNGYNQTVTTVTTNYTLLAADVGTRVYMNAAGATTITVNTGLFAAGDTVWLGNIGAGSCVVTAGTATVSKFSTASLTLSQYQGAYLYFVSTGVAILYSDSAGASIPLTTKGDLFGYDTANARIPIGTNNQVLTADSAQALGLKWATSTGFSSYASWTPIIDQGTTGIAQTGTQAYYATSGEFVHAYATINLNGAGTASNNIAFSVPVAPNALMNQQAQIGSGGVYDASASTMYPGFVIRNTASRFTIQPSNVASGYSMLGTSTMTAALAAGDAVYFNIVYRS
jgi:hypothetical protein